MTSLTALIWAAALFAHGRCAKFPKHSPPSSTAATHAKSAAGNLVEGHGASSNLNDYTEAMSRQMRHMFNTEPNVGSLDVVASSPGSWTPSADCTTPKLWLYVYGPLRTFDSTKDALKEMASLSSNDCYFVSAVTPDEEDDIEQKMQEAQGFFGGRFAYTIVTRQGMYTRHSGNEKGMQGEMWKPPFTLAATHSKALQPVLDVFWYTLQQNVNLAAPVLGITPDASSVVIRTRFDITFKQYYALDKLTSVFQSNPRGRHLAFATLEQFGGQGDYTLMTSYGAYSSDIAAAYEHDPLTGTGPFPNTARTNGWGFGYSVCGMKPSLNCSDQTQNSLADIDLGKRSECMDTSGPPSGKCCAGGRACAWTVVYSDHLSHQPDILRSGQLWSKPERMSGPHDLAQNVRLYCPGAQPNFDKAGTWYIWAGAFSVSRDQFDLHRSPNPWPAGC